MTESQLPDGKSQFLTTDDLSRTREQNRGLGVVSK